MPFCCPQVRVKRSDFLTEDFEVGVVQVSRHSQEEDPEEEEEGVSQDPEDAQQDPEDALPQDPEAKMRKINELLNMIESQVRNKGDFFNRFAIFSTIREKQIEK